MQEIGYISYCKSCGYRAYTKGLPVNMYKCALCNAKLDVGGPLWVGNIKNTECVNYIHKHLNDVTTDKVDFKLIDIISKELPTPLVYSIPQLTRILKVGSINQHLLFDRLSNEYSVSNVHYDPNMLRTTAPYNVIIKTILSLYKERIKTQTT